MEKKGARHHPLKKVSDVLVVVEELETYLLDPTDAAGIITGSGRL